MRKDRLVLLLLLATFALVGAQCGGNDEDDDKDDNYPSRAFAATALLRTYYLTQSMGGDMAAIKIPEGDGFDDDELSVEFSMGGGEVVQDVHVSVYLAPPRQSSAASTDIYARLRSPGGIVSDWKFVNWASSDKVKIQTDVLFHHEFDGANSSGTWRLQLRDPVEDSDGRALFRNATLRINGGEVSSVRTSNPTVPNTATQAMTLDSASGGVYDHIPELDGDRAHWDYADYGVTRMLVNRFNCPANFSVRAFTLVFSITVFDSQGSKPEDNGQLLLISPSGAFMSYMLGDPPETVDTGFEEHAVWQYTVSGSFLQSGEQFWFEGEPSLGTWTFALADTLVDGNTYELSEKRIVSSAIVDGGMTLTLTGEPYP